MNQKFLYILLSPPLLVLAVFLYFSLTSSPDTSSPFLTQVTPTPTPTPAPLTPLKLLFTGDVMFDRSLRSVAKKEDYSFILESMTEYLNDFDLVVANLEGPITDNESQSIDSEIGSTDNYIFTFDPQIVSVLEENNLTLLNLGNNHILNFDEEGLSQTTNYLEESELSYFGDTGTNLVSPFILQHFENIKIAFI